MATEPRPSDTAPIVAAQNSTDGQTDHPETHHETTPKNTLNLDRGFSLYFQDDALVIKNENAAKRNRRKVCGVPVGAPQPELLIPFHNVLWAEQEDVVLNIDYAVVSKNQVKLQRKYYELGDASKAAVTTWVEELLDRAYGQSQRRKRAKVFVNPHAGPGGAEKIWEHEVKPLFEAARMTLDVTRTKFSGEAVDLTAQLDIDAFDVVIPCSGDGLAYEVFNGLGKRPDARRALHQVAVAHIPCGSGNALSCNLNGSYRPGPAALAVIKGVRTPMDLMSVTHGEKRLLSFLSQSFGIVAEGDLGTEHMRWMGAARFDVGIAQRIFSKRTWPCEVSVKTVMSDKEEIKAHYKRAQGETDYAARKEGHAAEPASLNGDSASSQTDATSEGLPPLKYGTVNDKVPEDWETKTLDNLGNFYCGNMSYMAPNTNFFPASLTNDGYMDLVVNDGNISAFKYLELMTSIETGRFYDNPLVTYQKILAFRLTPKQKEGYISIDGERIPFEPFQVEIHPGLATVISKRGRYEAPGPTGWENVDATSPAGGK